MSNKKIKVKAHKRKLKSGQHVRVKKHFRRKSHSEKVRRELEKLRKLDRQADEDFLELRRMIHEGGTEDFFDSLAEQGREEGRNIDLRPSVNFNPDVNIPSFLLEGDIIIENGTFSEREKQYFKHERNLKNFSNHYKYVYLTTSGFLELGFVGSQIKFSGSYVSLPEKYAKQYRIWRKQLYDLVDEEDLRSVQQSNKFFNVNMSYEQRGQIRDQRTRRFAFRREVLPRLIELHNKIKNIVDKNEPTFRKRSIIVMNDMDYYLKGTKRRLSKRKRKKY